MGAARRAIRSRMRSGEVIQLEDTAVTLHNEGESGYWRDVLVTVTDEHLIWVVGTGPTVEAMSMRYDDVVRASYEGDMLRLTKRDPSNPSGEAEVWFGFPHADRGAAVRKALEARLGKIGPRKSEAAS